MAKTPEGKVKDALKAVIRKHSGYQFWPVQTGFGAATLDCFTCIVGHWFVIETKAKGGKLTPRQQMTRQAIIDAYGVVLVISTLEMVQKFDIVCTKLTSAVRKDRGTTDPLTAAPDPIALGVNSAADG